MRIEIHLPSGRLLAVEPYCNGYQLGRGGDGLRGVFLNLTCIPHSAMCGPFSLSPRIAAQSKQLAATSFREASIAAHAHVQTWGIA